MIGLIRAAVFEALTLLALFGVAMPLKYWASIPQMVSVIGPARKSRHAAVDLHTAARHRDPPAVLGVVEEQAVSVVPCVAGLVVRRGGKAAVRPPDPPVGSAFEVRAMAGRAVVGIQH